ncbi:fumble [Thecamonas trahens ATCC 50062]|uniref:Fumble n=1 Tax=Thecamonas trahens ATCC 50062 TaxID=461836 RepID=A0A0L0D3J3_THETB|nr:fumble [Thecamonas trahens ATCC 50062]KNC46785.1 fumble [Thecamonas trahens ATCC 50062]|eukprot:XP_013760061.1 fumble [Thecamonas trahens ATCC 50062]
MHTVLDAVAVDMGGSLSKLAFFEPDSGWLGETIRAWRRHPSYAFAVKEPSLSLRTKSGVLRFSRFETADAEALATSLALLADLAAEHPDAGEIGDRLAVTGGGAFKHRHTLEAAFASSAAGSVSLEPSDEMAALAAGFRFLMANHGPAAQSYWYTVDKDSMTLSARKPLDAASASLDAVLVNIGSGVSVLHLDGGPTGVARRISGSSIGGATFWGLCRLLTKYATFDEAIAGASAGSRDTVAMLVSDIYGSGYNAVGLDGSIVASDFGKISTMAHNPREPGVLRDADLARATLVLVLNNIAQISTLVADKIASSQDRGEPQLANVFFMGGMLRPGVMEDILVTGLDFWSGGSLRAAFSHHQNYLGALGALVGNKRSLEPSSLVATHVDGTLVTAPDDGVGP